MSAIVALVSSTTAQQTAAIKQSPEGRDDRRDHQRAYRRRKVAASHVWLLFFKNIGTNADRRFVNKGLVMVDGKPLALPYTPFPGSKGVFDDDYHPVPEVVHWDGDGDQDLLMGGCVTGMIFNFENTGISPDGTPLLKFRGPLEADGKVLDVEWCRSANSSRF